jgi:hypothetical protein
MGGGNCLETIENRLKQGIRLKYQKWKLSPKLKGKSANTVS